MNGAATDTSTDTTDSTDTEAMEEAIWNKLNDKGPQHPRDLLRCFHQLFAVDRDKALHRLKLSSRVIKNADGRLEAAA